MPHQISIAFQTDKPPAAYIALAKQVNQYDFDAVSVYSDAPYHPGFSALMLMAPHIERARVGVAAVSPARMSPIDMAANTALLAGIAKGGVYLGIARGAWLAEHGIREPENPIQAIREAVDIVKRLLTGESGGYEGQIYRITPHVKAPYPLPENPIPILIGTWGRQLCAVAGEIADEVKIGGTANPDVIPVIRGYIATGEKLVKRPANRVSMVVGAVTVVDEDREAARQAARRSVALYLPVVAKLDPTLSIDPDHIERIRQAVNAGQLGAAAALISDSLLDRFAFSGNADDLIRQIETLFAAGAKRVELGTPHGLPSETGIKIIGEKVIPALKRYRLSSDAG